MVDIVILRKIIMKGKIFRTRIRDLDVEYTVEFRKVKYVRWQIRYGRVKLIIPKGSRVNVEECFHRKENWIYRKLVQYEQDRKSYERKTRNLKLSNRSLDELKLMVSSFIDSYEMQLNVKVNRLQYRNMVHKWGSCSSLGNVTLSTSLRFLPKTLVAYIVYHELTHLIILAHNDEFFRIIRSKFPDYEEFDKQLSNYSYMIFKNLDSML